MFNPDAMEVGVDGPQKLDNNLIMNGRKHEISIAFTVGICHFHTRMPYWLWLNMLHVWRKGMILSDRHDLK